MRLINSAGSRALTTLALGSLAAGGAQMALATPAQASSVSNAAADFLARELAKDGNHLSVAYGSSSYADTGSTIDALMALTANGTNPAQARATTNWLVSNSATYYSYGQDLYAGALGKLIAATKARGLDPRSVAGVDLVAKLQSLSQTSGQFKDSSSSGDYSNAMGQSWDLIGLSRAGVAPSVANVDFLKAQQCSNGGFRLNFGGNTCTPDPDVTSLAIAALSTMCGQDAAINRAVAYLAGRQNAAGGVGGGTATTAPNTNSTGLAAAAFRIAGQSTRAARATAWVHAQQYGSTSPVALRGALAYNAASRTTGSTPTDMDRRSTAQGMLALVEADYVTASVAGATSRTCLTAGGATPSPTASTPSSSSSTVSATPASSSTAVSTASTTSSSASPTKPILVNSGVPNSDGSRHELVYGIGLIGLGALALTWNFARRPRRQH